MKFRVSISSAIVIACVAAIPAVAAAQQAPSWPLLSDSVAPSNAFADDFHATQGPITPSSLNYWRGFYIGGDFSFTDANADFSGATQAPIAYSLRELTLESQFAPSNWPVLGSASHAAAGFGGFVGYNFVYPTMSVPIVLGVEANYDQASLSLYAPNSPISRITPADTSGNNYLVNITGGGQVTNLDFGTLRARAGWAFGNFLPYAFVGAALGRADVSVTETTSGQQNPPSSGPCLSSSKPSCVPFSFTGTSGRNGELVYGFAVGTGLDVALTRNIFLRAEYEYVKFQPVSGIELSTNTFRAGGGLKF